MTPSQIVALVRFGAIACASLALVWVGYAIGSGRVQGKWDADKAQRERATREAIVTEARRGDKAVAAAEADKLTLGKAYEQLQALYALKRPGAALTVPARLGRVPHSTAQCDGGASAPPGDPAPARQHETEPGDPVFLTAGAVRMWNGYLAGADRPAGACGLAGGATDADPACAESSGLTVADAFANHAVNARLCAEDRAAHQRLIDFINQGPTE